MDALRTPITGRANEMNIAASPMTIALKNARAFRVSADDMAHCPIREDVRRAISQSLDGHVEQSSGTPFLPSKTILNVAERFLRFLRQ